MRVYSGIDIVDVSRVEDILRRRSERFVERVYTEGEREYSAQLAERYAARFAAKEATMKALQSGLPWKSIEVKRDARGVPELVLHGKAKRLADSKGIRSLSLSLSHSAGISVACVVALAED